MSSAIDVKNLTKTFKIYKKKPGLWGSVKSLFKREYTNLTAVNEVSFEIGTGELVGFIGPNGAGKTTTLKMLSGLLYPTSGSLEVLGYRPFQRKPEFLKQISLIMGQKNQLWPDLAAIETFNLNKEIYEVPDKQYSEILGELSEMLDIKEVMHQQVRKMSLGEKMKCELVASLLHKPKVLFLDEPTIGLDVIMQKKVRDFIKSYNEHYKSTVILTSHYMEDVKEVCERVLMINHGKIVFDGKTSELIKKYADHKILTLTFKKLAPRSELENIGKVVEYSDPKAVIIVPREVGSQKAAHLLTKYEIEDIEIHEPKLEDVIRKAYTE